MTIIKDGVCFQIVVLPEALLLNYILGSEIEEYSARSWSLETRVNSIRDVCNCLSAAPIQECAKLLHENFTAGKFSKLLFFVDYAIVFVVNAFQRVEGLWVDLFAKHASIQHAQAVDV